MNKNINSLLLALSLALFTLLSASAQAEDKIVSINLKQVEIGTKEKPTVEIELALSKTRDLHIAVQDTKTWRPIKRTMRRIKKSGKYHLAIDVEDLKPGIYRVDAYITPKGKDWNARFGDTIFNNLTVLDQEFAPKPSIFADKDVIRSINWPKVIDHNNEVVVSVNFDITEPRDLHIKLLDSSNWQEYGSMKFPVKQPGDVAVPLDQVQDNFPPGKYAWVAYLTESNTDKKVTKELGWHFKISKD